MEVRNGLSLLNSFFPLNGQVNGQALPPQPVAPTKTIKKSAPLEPQDKISLSRRPSLDGENTEGNKRRQPNGLISERTEEIENGFRRLQQFQNNDGRKFTRIEEVINNDKQSRRTVVQQAASGSTTLLENIIDRQEDGSFRITSRFVDETGVSKTNIQYNQTPDDVDFILGKPPQPRDNNAYPFKTLRGTAINVEV